MKTSLRAQLIVVTLLFACIPLHTALSEDVPPSASTPAGQQAIETLNKQIEDRKTKIKELEESIERTKKNIEKKQLEATSLKNQMTILDNHIEQVQLDVDLTEQKLSTLALEIDALDISIKDKEAKIERHKIMIAELLRALHYGDGKNAISILAGYKSFSDFYNQLQYLQMIDIQLGEQARALSEAKTQLEGQKMQVENRQKSYEALKRELDNRKQDLGEQLFAKQDLLADTNASERTYKALLTNLRKQYQDIENEITRIEQEVRQRLEEEEKLKGSLEPEFNGTLSWPTQSHYITTYFHDPEYPFRNVFEHSGLDIRSGQGTPIRAAGSGYVARAKRCTSSSCYSYIMIVHTGGISTLYGHMSRISVTEDQFVTRGDIIGNSGGAPGTVGAGPFVTGPHLHFEVRKNGIPVNPLAYLSR